MRIINVSYGDGYKVQDELPFDLNSIAAAAHKILSDDLVDVANWPITVDYVEAGDFWELWFSRPLSDEEYEAWFSNEL